MLRGERDMAQLPTKGGVPNQKRAFSRMSVDMILPMPMSQVLRMRGTGVTMISTSCWRMKHVRLGEGVRRGVLCRAKFAQAWSMCAPAGRPT